MPKHPENPHLFVVTIDGRETAVVRSMSLPEARDFFVDKYVVVERLTPARAFRVGQRGLFDIENAKPEYDDSEAAPDLFEESRQWSEEEVARMQQQRAEGVQPHSFNQIHTGASPDASEVPHV